MNQVDRLFLEVKRYIMEKVHLKDNDFKDFNTIIAQYIHNKIHHINKQVYISFCTKILQQYAKSLRIQFMLDKLTQAMRISRFDNIFIEFRKCLIQKTQAKWLITIFDKILHPSNKQIYQHNQMIINNSQSYISPQQSFFHQSTSSSTQKLKSTFISYVQLISSGKLSKANNLLKQKYQSKFHKQIKKFQTSYDFLNSFGKGQIHTEWIEQYMAKMAEKHYEKQQNFYINKHINQHITTQTQKILSPQFTKIPTLLNSPLNSTVNTQTKQSSQLNLLNLQNQQNIQIKTYKLRNLKIETKVWEFSTRRIQKVDNQSQIELQIDCEQCKQLQIVITKLKKQMTQQQAKFQNELKQQKQSFHSQKSLLSLQKTNLFLQSSSILSIQPTKNILTHLSLPSNSKYLYQNIIYKQFLLKEITKYRSSYKRKCQIKGFRLVFKENAKMENFHKYIDGVEDLLVLIRLQNDNIIGGYSISPLAQSQPSYNGFLLQLNPPSTYPLITPLQCLVYDEYFFIMGNSQIRIRMGQDMVYSNFGITKASFLTNGKGVKEFLGAKGREEKYLIFQAYEVLVQEE